MNQNEVFHKTPSSQFYFIGTFSGPNPLSLILLITCLLTMIDLIEGNSQNQSLGTPFEVSSFNPFFSFFLLFFLCFDLISCFVYVIACLLSLVLCLFDVHEHSWLLDLGFSFMLCFSISYF